ncbi:MAG: terminase TerL endonuclease subunit [Leucobacter sp.]
MSLGGNARSKFEDLSEPPWYRWRVRDPAERCIRFIEQYCRSPKGAGHGKPIVLAQFQKEWIRTILQPGIRQAVLQAPRGQGKSTLLAAIALWSVFDRNPTGQPIVPIMATTVGQAARSVYDVACKMVAAEPELSRRALVYTAISNAKIVVGYNGGECFPIANDVDGLQGLDPTCAIVDEIGFQPLDAWQAVVMASGKREQSLVVGIGTPGVDREKSALWHLREVFLGGDVPDGFSFTELSAPDDCDYRDESNWLIANPAIAEGYLSIDALRTDVRMAPEAEFRMFRLGQWVEGTDCWLGVDGRKVWRALESTATFTPGADTWVGVDIGLTNDTTAIVVGQKIDGVLHTSARIWDPREDGRTNITAVMQYLRDLDKKYHLVEVAFDPRSFDVASIELADEGLPMVEYPQSGERMIPACMGLYEAIVNGLLSHDGARDYEAQILNAMPIYSDAGFRLTKRKSRGKIDAAIALAMMHDRASRPAPKRAPAFVL